MKLDLARKIAEALLAEIRPHCVRCEIAGSIRREKPYDIKDIEIVAIPKLRPVKAGLFAEDVSTENELLENWARKHPQIQWIKPGTGVITPWEPKADGKYWRGLITEAPELDQAVKLDLFLTTPEQWGVIFMIRTGPSEFSQKMVTQKHKAGWLPNQYRIEDGFLRNQKGEVIPTPEEEDFFRLAGYKCLPPRMRGVA